MPSTVSALWLSTHMEQDLSKVVKQWKWSRVCHTTTVVLVSTSFPPCDNLRRQTHNPKVLVLRHYFPRLEKMYSLLFWQPLKGGQMIVDYAMSSISRPSHSDFTLLARLHQFPALAVEEKVAECLDHIGAGIDTTGDALCFLLWELSQPHNGKRMQRLSEEVRGCDPMNAAELATLPYLNAVIEETLRLWAPGTLPLPRYVPAGGRMVDGYFVLMHTIVSCQSYTMHRIDQTVSPDPSAFHPER